MPTRAIPVTLVTSGDLRLAAKVAMMQHLGVTVHPCGTDNGLVG